MVDFHYKKTGLLKVLFISLILTFNALNIQAQSFSQSNLNFNGFGGISNGTSLMFGPDGRLYVAEYTGTIKIYTIDRIEGNNYTVTSAEFLTGLNNIKNHNDDGSTDTSTYREFTGLTLAGTPTNPIIYATSSDFRIGGGGGGGNGDLGLDTNSGVITRFSWNGNTWDEVDLVRGLPRSEENHATNGLEFITVNGEDYLIVASGGHTNGGSPSINFAYTSEYALSAAILSVNLSMLNNMPVLNDNGRKYIYDIPTLDDPSRPNVNGITDPDIAGYDGVDINDPFGGNDGLNQAMIIPNGPVQIFSPGYRNSFDLVVTENGAVYCTDNGANGGWGGFPKNEGMDPLNPATNDYVLGEPGGNSATPDGEMINNKDHLSLITLDIQNYSFGSFYGGHPNPTRANPMGAGLYINPDVTGNTGAVFREMIFDPDGSRTNSTSNPNIALPANWPPVPVSEANLQEGDWRGPGISNPDGPDDAIITTWGTNTNGIDEYTASNFNNAMKGDLLAGVNTGELRRVQLKPDGTLESLTTSWASGLGGDALGVTCNSDSEIFPGTIWVVTLNGKLIVLEPQDFGVCLQPNDAGYSPTADNDFDGYTNQDEIDNGTDICSGGSQPNDFDKDAGGVLVSDLNDSDDDNDGILDSLDPFQLGDPLTSGSDAFTLPVFNELFSSNTTLNGYSGLGFTGMMNNGLSNPNWLNWLDRRDDPNDPNPNDVLGGAIGAMTMQMTSGTALGTTNNQEKGFQYGVQVNQNSGVFTVVGSLSNLNTSLQLYGNSNAPNGELGIYIGDGTQSNYIKFVITPDGLTALQEINDIDQAPLHLAISSQNRPNGAVNLFFVIDPSNGETTLQYSFDAGARTFFGTISSQGNILSAIQQSGTDLAVGLIGSSNATGVEVEGTWDFLNVSGNGPGIVTVLPDLDRLAGDADEEIDLDTYFNDDNGVGNLTYSVAGNTNTDIAAVIAANLLTLSYPSTAGTSAITIRATDLEANFVEQTFNVNVSAIEEPLVLYRVNAGGPVIASLDGGVAWGGDTRASKSPYLSQAGNNNTSGFSMISYSPEVDLSTTPTDIYTSERYDATAGAPNLSYSFPVSQPGTYEVRLYMGNGWSGTSGAGARIFDVSINGVLYPALKDLDLSGTFGHQVGSVITETVEISGSSIDISFIHGAIENPLVNGIEILNSTGSGTPISLSAVADQLNAPGESLDGSLVVSASGGDGSLTYSMTGAPLGVIIEPTNGQIGGEIDASADLGSPYTVTISVDDNDGLTTDVVTTSFTWTITNEIQSVWKNKNESENYTGRHECSFVQAGDKFYLLGGRENSKTLDIYDYTSNTWTSLANSAPFEFNHFQAIEYQGLIWVIGSFKNNSYPSESPTENIWIFDPANQEWIQGPAIPTSRQRGSTGLVEYNDKFYIVGGNTNGHNGGYVAWFDEYDPATGIWTILEDAPRARDHFHAAIIDDKIYAVGGRLSGGVGGTFKPVISEVDVYDLSLKSWTTLPSGSNLPSPRGAPAVVNFNNKILVIGGEVQDELIYNVSTTDAVKVTEEFDPSTGNWVRKADLNSERHGTQALVSGNGVFIIGGSPNLAGGNQKNLEYYGEDAPIGVPSMASDLSAPESVQISESVPEDIILQTINGNMGVYITSMELSGPNMNNFSIDSGELTNSLLKTNSSHSVSVSYSGATPGETATLTINYGGANQVSILLESVLDQLNTSLTQSKEVQSSIGIEENIQNSSEFDVQIYPNPSSIESFLKISDPTIEVHKIYLYDFNGRLIKYFVGKESYINDGLYRVNLQGLPDGVYLVKLETSIFNNLSLRLIIKN
jgi:hypothetical protein